MMTELRASRHDIPSFTLSDERGDPVRAWDYRQRRNLVLLLSEERNPAARAAAALAERLCDLKALDAEVLVVHQSLAEPAGDWYAAELGVRQANDPTGGVAAQLGLAASLPAVVVANRYGVIYATLPATSREVGYQALDWIEFVSIQCSE